MKDKDWLDRVLLGATVYKDKCLHGGVESSEVFKFVEWLYKQYGVVYNPNLYDKTLQNENRDRS